MINVVMGGLLVFLFFSINPFDVCNLRNDAYLECIMNSSERTIVINGQLIHCQCGKFATNARFEVVHVVGYCEQHMPKAEEEKPVKKEEAPLKKDPVITCFPKPPEPILNKESEK